MALLTEKKFSFISLAGAIPEDSFAVVSFKGFEAISSPYEFEFILVSENQDIDPLLVLENPAKFTIHRDNGENVDFNGILTQFEETQEFNGYLFFKAVLAPKLWWLSLTHHNQVFLDLTIPEIMEQALKDGGLAKGIDFEFRIQQQYEPLEYVCQYNESHLNFISRWAEREGIYYFFEQTVNGEKVIFTDTKISHVDLPYDRQLIYQPESGLDSLHTKEVVKNFICRHNLLPKRVYLKDYNYLKPSLAIEGIADVDENGRGENYIYGEHFETPEQGNRLAEIRAEELKCRKSLFTGKSSVPFMMPGFTFNLKNYYKIIYNRKYLITDITHEGHQTGYLISGLMEAVASHEESMMYRNIFTAIYSDAQFRPVRKAEKPKISGTLNAKVDAASSGEYAELDELGRYKVILPFDRSGRFNGKASAWFRMMQPYAGENQGMHFPLHKGTEVLLTFMDGDPDRPVIAGAVPNPETSSPVTSGNQTKSVITTGKNSDDHSAGAAEYARGTTQTDTKNYIEFEDLSGSERIRIHSDGNIWIEAQNRYAEYTIGGPLQKTDVPDGLKYLWDKFYAASNPGFNPTGMQAYSYGTSATGATPAVDISSLKKLARTGKIQLAKGDTFNTQEGNIYDFGGYWNYNLGNCYVEEHLDQSAELNKTRNYDLTDKGGPGWTKLDWAKAKDSDASECPSEGDIMIGAAGQWDDTSGGTNVRVNKSFGCDYSYSESDSVEVSTGSSLSIQHGGRHVEMGFRGNGSASSWSWSEAGVHKEKKWTPSGDLLYKSESDQSTGITSEHKYCRTTGNLLSYSTSHQGFNSVHSYDYNWANTASAGITFAASASFDLKMSIATSLDISLGADFDFSLYGAINTDISAYLAGKLDLSAYAGLSLEASAYAAIKLEMSLYASIKIAMELSGALDMSLKTGSGIAIEMDTRSLCKIEYDGPSGKFVVKAAGYLSAERAESLAAKLDTLRVRM